MTTLAANDNYNFHQTFKPEAQYLSALLELSSFDQKSLKEISGLTGIPQGESSGKVEPHLSYMQFFGLADCYRESGLYSFNLTRLGSEIFNQDPGLQESLTICLLHGMITRPVRGAPVWKDAFRNILSKYHNKPLEKHIFLRECEEVSFDRTNKKNIAPFFGSYEDIFSPLGLVEQADDSVRVIPAKRYKEFVFAYALILFEHWNDFYEGRDEITSTEFDKIGFRHLFGWTTAEEYKTLELMADNGLIRMNRQLMPYTILKLSSEEDLIARLYSDLC